MVRMFVRHAVEDFDRWKEAYDGFEAARRDNGVRDAAVFRGAENPRDVTVWHDFDDLAAARAFAESPQLAEVMRDAGVVSDPQFWYVERDLPA